MTMKEAVGKVLEGWTLPNAVRNILEEAYFAEPQRTWVVLTDDEIDQGLLRTNYAMQTARAWRDGVRWAYHQLKEKNNA